MDRFIRFRTSSSSQASPGPSTPSSSSSREKGKGRAMAAPTPISVDDDDSDPEITDNTLLPLSQTVPPETEKRYIGRRFEIRWKKLYWKTNHLCSKGEVGYKIETTQQASSSIYEYGATVQWRYWKDGRSFVKRLWCCEICHNKNLFNDCLYSMSGYNAIYQHLKRNHGIYRDEKGKLQVLISNQSSIADFSRDNINNQSDSLPQHRFDIDIFQKAFIDWAIKQNASYRSGTSDDTRDIICFGRDWLEKSVWKSPSTLSKYIEEAYRNRCYDIKEILCGSQSKIHLSCDVWKSTNNMSLLGVVAHFLGKYLFYLY